MQRRRRRRRSRRTRRSRRRRTLVTPVLYQMFPLSNVFFTLNVGWYRPEEEEGYSKQKQ
jgi:hypothetical protein